MVLDCSPSLTGHWTVNCQSGKAKPICVSLVRASCIPQPPPSSSAEKLHCSGLCTCSSLRTQLASQVSSAQIHIGLIEFIAHSSQEKSNAWLCLRIQYGIRNSAMELEWICTGSIFHLLYDLGQIILFSVNFSFLITELECCSLPCRTTVKNWHHVNKASSTMPSRQQYVMNGCYCCSKI